MALRNLLVCITSAGGKNDLPCVVLHSPSRDIALHAARSILASLRPCGPSRTERHILPAVDPGRHATTFEYERAITSLMIDLSQSEVARSSAVDWVAPIAPTRHVQGARRSIVLHCADLLSWAHQNALKKIIESSQSNTLFILTTSQATALQAAIISRAVVIRCPTNDNVTPRPPLKEIEVMQSGCNADDKPSEIVVMTELELMMTACVAKAMIIRSPMAASKAAREAAYAISKLYNGSTAPMFLRTLLNILMANNRSDHEHWDTIQEVMNVDLQINTGRSPTSRASTLTVALHKVLLTTCVENIHRARV